MWSNLILKHFNLGERVSFFLDKFVIMFDIIETLVKRKQFIFMFIIDRSLQ